MGSVDYRTLAGDILANVGGEANVVSATHCATRLRLRLRDSAQADKLTIEKLPGVVTVVQAAGEFQVVIGNNVPLVFAELGKITKLGTDIAAQEKLEGNLLNRFVALISR